MTARSGRPLPVSAADPDTAVDVHDQAVSRLLYRHHPV